MKRVFKSRINQQGFTMIEMVVVLIVLAIVTTVIAYRPTAGSNDLIAQTEILKSHLRYAQIRAMNETYTNTNPVSPPWGIHILTAGSYILYKNNATATNDILPGEKSGVAPAPQTHTFPVTVTVTSGVGTTFNFNEWGKPVDAGGTAIATAQTIMLSQGADTRIITITKNTGYIP
jgi:prepilin-type N-terminal cleavage/methylation domain-containing protein